MTSVLFSVKATSIGEYCIHCNIVNTDVIILSPLNELIIKRPLCCFNSLWGGVLEKGDSILSFLRVKSFGLK